MVPNARQATEIEKAYYAGIMDGEGCISIYHQPKPGSPDILRYNVRIQVGMTDSRAVRKMYDQYGGTVYTRLKSKNPNWKLSTMWYLTGKRVTRFLLDIYPYLILKTGQAELALELRNLIALRRRHEKGRKGTIPLTQGEYTQRKSLKTAMHVLNRRGVHAT